MRNPFEHPLITDEAKRERVLELLKTLMLKTKTKVDESILSDIDPDNVFTPLHLVANMLEVNPKTLHAILKSGNKGKTYGEVIKNLEDRLGSTYDINKGILPPAWIKSKGRVGDQELPSEFNDLFNNIGENSEDARRILDWGV